MSSPPLTVRSQLLTEMERGLLLSLLLSPLLAIAFRTDNCSHHDLQEALTQYEACMDQTITVNICSAFAQVDICFPRSEHSWAITTFH